MKTNIIALLLLIVVVDSALGQFRYDNKVFRNIYFDDLCDELRKHPDALILDVRSEGEFADTSRYTGLNIGHLKRAKNINIRNIENRLGEIADYKNRPIYLYCSHSQRSRASSKLLIDSGFTNVTNINGGLTDLVHHKDLAKVCFDDLYETSNKFKLVAPLQVAELLAKKNKIFVLDIRPDSVYRGISKDAMLNSGGRINNSVNIPEKDVAARLSELPKNKTILLVDDYGNESSKIAKMLVDKGFNDVVVLFNGMMNWISEGSETLSVREKVWKHQTDFEVISTDDFHKQMTTNPNTILLDIRPSDQFNNQDKQMTWHNRGHIRNAVNIPIDQLKSRLSELDKSKDIVVYGFGSGSRQSDGAKILADAGFKHVKAFNGGIFGLLSRAANVKGKAHLKEYVVDVPEENL